jgi:putative intracellular protease/amidase
MMLDMLAALRPLVIGTTSRCRLARDIDQRASSFRRTVTPNETDTLRFCTRVRFVCQETDMSATRNKVLFVLTSHDRKGDKPSGFNLSEVTHPYRVLVDAGYDIDFVSPKGGKAPVDPESLKLDDGTNAEFWNNPALRSTVENTKQPTDVKASDYAGIFFAGGHGAMWDLPDDTALAEITASIYEHRGIVGAICQGSAALVNVKRPDGQYLIKNMHIAASTNEEEREAGLDRVVPFVLADRLVRRGAHHDAGPNWSINVCVSGRLVTGQNPESSTRLGDAMLTMLHNAAH